MAASKRTAKIKSWIERRDDFTEWNEAYITGDEVALAATELNLRQSEILAVLHDLDADYDTESLDEAETAAHDQYVESLRPPAPPEILALRKDLEGIEFLTREGVLALADRHGVSHNTARAAVYRADKMDPAWKAEIEARRNLEEEDPGYHARQSEELERGIKESQSEMNRLKMGIRSNENKITWLLVFGLTLGCGAIYLLFLIGRGMFSG